MFLTELMLENLQGVGQPTVTVFDEGFVGMTWENERQHVNIAFFKGKKIEVFWENLKTGETRGYDFVGVDDFGTVPEIWSLFGAR